MRSLQKCWLLLSNFYRPKKMWELLGIPITLEKKLLRIFSAPLIIPSLRWLSFALSSNPTTLSWMDGIISMRISKNSSRGNCIWQSKMRKLCHLTQLYGVEAPLSKFLVPLNFKICSSIARTCTLNQYSAELSLSLKTIRLLDHSLRLIV